MRLDGRKNDELRPIKITRQFIKYAEGSVLIETGNTKVVCTATVENAVPQFLKDTGKGWITAEYGMLPRCAETRIPREGVRVRTGGRTQEIQRLVGRSLRAVTILPLLGERTIWIDCDVIQADGGTRAAAITGGYVALYDALTWMKTEELIEAWPLSGICAAVSVGLVEGQVCLDLCYAEDSRAAVDFNLVMTDKGEFIEIQGTGEESTFSQQVLEQILGLGKQGIETLIREQQKALNL